jgi:hypothetical protein
MRGSGERAFDIPASNRGSAERKADSAPPARKEAKSITDLADPFEPTPFDVAPPSSKRAASVPEVGGVREPSPKPARRSFPDDMLTGLNEPSPKPARKAAASGQQGTVTAPLPAAMSEPPVVSVEMPRPLVTEEPPPPRQSSPKPASDRGDGSKRRANPESFPAVLAVPPVIPSPPPPSEPDILASPPLELDREQGAKGYRSQPPDAISSAPPRQSPAPASPSPKPAGVTTTGDRPAPVGITTTGDRPAPAPVATGSFTRSRAGAKPRVVEPVTGKQRAILAAAGLASFAVLFIALHRLTQIAMGRMLGGTSVVAAGSAALVMLVFAFVLGLVALRNDRSRPLFASAGAGLFSALALIAVALTSSSGDVGEAPDAAVVVPYLMPFVAVGLAWHVIERARARWREDGPTTSVYVSAVLFGACLFAAFELSPLARLVWRP